jgi:peptide/nickel transport system permease protein
MFRHLIKKFLRLLSVLVAVTALTFLMMDVLPGDVAYEIAGADATVEGVKALREALGLDRHIFIRYGDWLAGVVQGDFGRSLLTHEPVANAIFACLPVTLELMMISQILALVLAIPIGIISAYRSRSGLDRAFSATAFAFMSAPVFVMAMVLIYIFALKLRWLPATGFAPLSEGLLANIRSLMLPAASLALLEWAPLMRVLRSDMIATLQETFILSAKAKGLPARKILFNHALKPSSFTLITILGIHIGHLVGGAVIVESIFALPGIGRLLVGAIYSRDLNMVQGCILLITLGYVVVNFLVDALYAVLDPRVRAQVG